MKGTPPTAKPALLYARRVGVAKHGSRTHSGAQVHPRIQYRAYLAVSSRGLLAGNTQEITCFGVSSSLKSLDQGPSAALSDLRCMNYWFAKANESHAMSWNCRCHPAPLAKFCHNLWCLL
jgi:hypothetical protein